MFLKNYASRIGGLSRVLGINPEYSGLSGKMPTENHPEYSGPHLTGS